MIRDVRGPALDLPRGPRGLQGAPPAHEIDGDRVRWRNPDGTWGAWLDAGEAQAPGIRYAVSTTLGDADPGPGTLRFSASQQNASTALRLDLLDANGIGVSALLDSWGESASSVKGQLRIASIAVPTRFLWFNVTAIASPSGYRNFTVDNRGSSATSPFANGEAVLVSFTRSGDPGSLDTAGEAYISAAVANKADKDNPALTGDLTLTDTDDTAAAGPQAILHRISASPAAADVLAEILFRGRNDAAENIDYAAIRGVIDDAADGSEDGGLAVLALIAGVSTEVMRIGLGVRLAASLAMPGAGKLNALGLSISGVDVRRPNRAYDEYVANAALTTVLPFDDTVPTSSEGTQILSATITPRSVNSRIRARLTGFGDAAGDLTLINWAIFRGGVCIRAGATAGDGTVMGFGGMIEEAPNSTAALTYTVRVGPSASGSVWLNGWNGNRRFGGKAATTLELEEVFIP